MNTDETIIFQWSNKLVSTLTNNEVKP